MVFHGTLTASLNDLPSRILNGVKSVFSFIGASFVPMANANRRMRRVARLSEKSDAELAELGIRREDIVRHVFVDMSRI